MKMEGELLIDFSKKVAGDKKGWRNTEAGQIFLIPCKFK